MPQLTDQGLQKIKDLAQRYAVSTDAVMTLLQALLNSRCTMAQFDHHELGGAGQWMAGGMTMVGDMFNHGLKAKVDGLCSELSQLVASQPIAPSPASFQSQSQNSGQRGANSDFSDADSVSLFVPETAGGASGQWWPAELGSPNGTGAQNQVRYAYFNPTHRLAVELNGQVTVYDTLDHKIGGVSQQQGRGGSLTLTSQHGTVSVSTLPVISVDGVQITAAAAKAEESKSTEPDPPAHKSPESRSPTVQVSGTSSSAYQRAASARNAPGDGHLRQDRAAGRIAQQRHSLAGRIFSQEIGAAVAAVSDGLGISDRQGRASSSRPSTSSLDQSKKAWMAVTSTAMTWIELRAFAEVQHRSPHERSEMREWRSKRAPGYRFAHPGYSWDVMRGLVPRIHVLGVLRNVDGR